MKRLKLIALTSCILIALTVKLHSQNDPVLLTVAGEQITKSEFLKVYQKNNIKGEPITQGSLEEYLELYINFKLKVKEAEALGLDTVHSFVNELEGYRNQLIQPFFTDKETDSLLLIEAYERSLWDIRASHILVEVAHNALPEDTLEKYNLIMSLRNRILKGESFEKIAREESEDRSARDVEATDKSPAIKGNAGDLGYFTVFDLVYPFENAAYKLKVGEVSMPVRTDFGYHLIKVYDKKKAMGKVQVAHILISIPQGSSKADSLRIKAKTDSIYNAIISGSDFEQMAADVSEDKGSATKGGVLPWFGTFRMVPEFISAISALQNKGDMPKPVLTSYGWHIIKLIDRKGIGSFEESKADTKTRLQRDTRSAKSRETVIRRIKNEYAFKEYKGTREEFYGVVTDSIFSGSWDAKEAAHLNKPMFTLGDKTYTQKDFAKYINKNQFHSRKTDIRIAINDFYQKWVQESCINYEDKNLENKHAEFRTLMKEYRDGILLFDLTDQMVWSKAIKDTTGLRSFYELHKNKHMWKDRVVATIYKCENEAIAKSTRKLIKKTAKKGISNDSIMKTINKGGSMLLEIKSGKFQKNENEAIDKVVWKPGISPNIIIEGKVVFVDIKKVLPAQPKELKEVKGLMTADYQKYLDEQWIKDLRQKYTYFVNKDVLNSITNH